MSVPSGVARTGGAGPVPASLILERLAPCGGCRLEMVCIVHAGVLLLAMNVFLLGAHCRAAAGLCAVSPPALGSSLQAWWAVVSVAWVDSRTQPCGGAPFYHLPWTCWFAVDVIRVKDGRRGRCRNRLACAHSRGALETEKNATVGKCRRDLGGKPLLVLEGLPRLAGIRVCTDLAAP